MMYNVYGIDVFVALANETRSNSLIAHPYQQHAVVLLSIMEPSE